MKAIDDWMGFLLDYATQIFSKGWHWLILFIVTMLLVSVLLKGCDNTNIKPLNWKENISINETNVTNAFNVTNDINAFVLANETNETKYKNMSNEP